MQNPDDPKVLILGTSYIPSVERKNDVILWSRLCRRLNPELEILLVDSNSPFDPRNFKFGDGFDCDTVVHMEENLGHPTTDRDGWGRDFCFGIEYASARGFDWIAFIESDLMFYRPVMPIIKKMMRLGVLFSSPMNFRYAFMETGLMFLSVPALCAMNFIEKYNWPSHRSPFYCEEHIQKILEDEWMILPLRGTRNDENELTRDNFIGNFPYGCDYLTHCSDKELYTMGMKMNGIEL